MHPDDMRRDLDAVDQWDEVDARAFGMDPPIPEPRLIAINGLLTLDAMAMLAGGGVLILHWLSGYWQ